MAGIDAILKLAMQHRATEVRLVSNARPVFMRQGKVLPNQMPPTTPRMLAQLLGSMYNTERRDLIQAGETVTCVHSGAGAKFQVSMWGEERGLAVKFLRMPDDASPVVDPRRVRSQNTFRSTSTVSPDGSQAASKAARPGPAPPRNEAAPRRQSKSRSRSRSRIDEPVMTDPVATSGDAPAPHHHETASVGPELKGLLEEAADRDASDVHLVEGSRPAVRIHGKLGVMADEPRVTRRMFDGLVTPSHAKRLERGGGTAHMVVAVPGVGRFRGTLYRCEDGFAASFRIVRRRVRAWGKLNLPVELDRLFDLHHGLVLVCGPSGCGKSTTMASYMQDWIEKRGGVLVTLEDPIEYVIESSDSAVVRQRQLGEHVTDYATGIRDLLRTDFNALLVGELRTKDAVRHAVSAAEMGHLVIAALPSPTGVHAIERVVSAFPPEHDKWTRFRVTNVLRAVVAQRLLPRHALDGQVPAAELLNINRELGRMIRQGDYEKLPDIFESRVARMIQLEACLAEMVNDEIVSRDAAMKAAADPALLRNLLK